MLCISTVSARATGEIKSTWLGDVALILGGGERGREREEEGEKGKKGIEEGGRRRGKKKEERRQREVEEQEVVTPAFPRWQPRSLARALALSGALTGVCCMQGRESACSSMGLWKKTFSLKTTSNLTHSEAGAPAVLAAQEAWGTTWPSS